MARKLKRSLQGALRDRVVDKALAFERAYADAYSPQATPESSKESMALVNERLKQLLAVTFKLRESMTFQNGGAKNAGPVAQLPSAEERKA